MPWVRFDDQFPIHRKVKGLSDPAFRLHAEAIFWCARNLTDGFVPASDLPDLATARRPLKFVPELVSRGNWSQVEGGWQIHDYLEYQPSKAKVDQERKAKGERQKRWLDKRKASPVDNSVKGDASIDASQDTAPSRPAPKEAGSGRPRASGAAGRTGPKGPAVRAVPPWCGHCDERTRQVELLDGRMARCSACHPLRDRESA